jgi:uncharacterized membrane protein
MRRSRWLLLLLLLLLLLPPVREALTTFVVGPLYAVFSVFLLLSIAGLLFWYVYRICLKGLIRQRRLRLIRFYRESRRINLS